jgi:hypothetical protein
VAAAACALHLLLCAALPAAAQQFVEETNGILRVPNPAARKAPPGTSPARYKCSGVKCCDYTCTDDTVGADDVCALSPKVGLWVAKSTLDTGFESCALKVATNYDRGIKCSQALPVNAKCGDAAPFACGYGLACVAMDIDNAACLPV